MDRRHTRFDTTINVANVLSVIVILLALWGMSVRLESRLTALEVKIGPMWDNWNLRNVAWPVPPPGAPPH